LHLVGLLYIIVHSECVCSLRYPACIAHVPYCYLWPVLLYSIFPTLSHERQDLPKKLYWK